MVDHIVHAELALQYALHTHYYSRNLNTFISCLTWRLERLDLGAWGQSVETHSAPRFEEQTVTSVDAL